MQSENNKRIAKNTLFLYIRMLITMVVSLYTSRVVLNTLGINDFGIYNVVGGVVAMFGFITNTMALASQRFLAYEIGRNDTEKLKMTFNVSLIIYMAFALAVLILGETIGLWFIQNKLTIPEGRMMETLFVYQFSLFAFIVTILRIPYNSIIIAHEKMSFYAWSSIIEVSLKLLIVFMLLWIDFDKLILYGILIFCVVLIITIIYVIYCRFIFVEIKYQYLWDSVLFHKMLNFSGWSLFDSLANVAKNQGVNIILNMFFNPGINAARGIAYQISTQILSFVGNFQLASSPQITKYYALGEKLKLKELYFLSSRLSFFLLFIISLPVLIEMEIILKLWLIEVPAYTLIFSRLIIINRLIDCLAGTSNSVIQATGKIKHYQIFSGIIMLTNLPLSYLLIRNGYAPEITLVVSIIVSVILVSVRLYIIQIFLEIKVLEYFNEVVKSNLIISFIASILPIILYLITTRNLTAFLLVSFLSLITSFISIYFIGLKKGERRNVILLLRKSILKLKN